MLGIEHEHLAIRNGTATGSRASAQTAIIREPNC